MGFGDKCGPPSVISHHVSVSAITVSLALPRPIDLRPPPTPPPQSDNYASQASARVLTDSVLWRGITTFQAGLPRGLYDFWVAHEPSVVHSTDRFGTTKGFTGLLQLVVQHGTVHQLDALSNVKYFKSSKPSEKPKTVNFRNLSRQAIEANRADMLEWAIAHNTLFEPRATVWQTAIRHHRDGDTRTLDVLRVHKSINATQLPSVLEMYDVELVRWIGDHFPASIDVSFMDHALYSANYAIVKYLLDHHPTHNFGEWLIKSLIYSGKLDIFRCTLEKRPTEIDRDVIRHLIVHDHHDKDFVKVIAELGSFEDVAREVAASCISSGDLALLERLFDDGLLPSGEPFSLDVAFILRLDVIRFLEDRQLATATTEAMDAAAERKQWDVVMYLHANRSEGCTTRVMDAAAAQGRLTDVCFFHENRSEGGSTRAMDVAAENGHFNVVMFLHAKRNEGCTADGVKAALKNGHLEIVRFLYEHYRELFGPDMLHGLLLHGAFEIWAELRELYQHEANAVVESALLDAGEHFELPTIQFIIHDLGHVDLAHVAVNGAAKSDLQSHDAQWPRAVMRISGPESCRLSAIRNAVVAASPHHDLSNLQFLISVCCESEASQVATTDAKENWQSESLVQELEAWVESGCTQPELPPVHPLLLDTRTPSWAVELALMGCDGAYDPYSGSDVQIPWAVRAVNKGDCAFLEIVKGSQVDDSMFSFEGARVAAVRRGNLRILQWLLSNVDVPVELTLLDEALYYHQFEVAEWLAANCADACWELNWDAKVAVTSLGRCGLADGVLLSWIEEHAAVRDLVDFGGIARHAAKYGDVDTLRELHRTHPEVFETHQNLEAAAGDAVVRGFLMEIGYAFMH